MANTPSAGGKLARGQLHRLVRCLAWITGRALEWRARGKVAIIRWRSSHESMRQPPVYAESRAHQQDEGKNRPSILWSTSTARQQTSAAASARNHASLTCEELDAIMSRSEAERRFLVGDSPVPVELLSDRAHLAIVEVPRLVRMCMSVSPSNETQDQLRRAHCGCHAGETLDGKRLKRRSQACSPSAASPG